MSRKKGKSDKHQMTFQFKVDMADLMSLEGGSQDALSDFEFRFRQMLKLVLDDCGKRTTEPLDRFEVAARMSRLLGREVTKSNLDQWTAMATIQRRMHIDALKALCEVTGDYRPLHYFVEACGFKALAPEEAIYAEYGAKMMFRKMLDNEIKDTLSGVDEAEMRKRLLKRFKGGDE